MNIRFVSHCIIQKKMSAFYQQFTKKCNFNTYVMLETAKAVNKIVPFDLVPKKT